VSIGSAGLAAALSQCADSSPALGAELALQTVRNAQLFVAGTGDGGIAVATKITSLAQGALTTMFLTKLSTTVCILALAAALVLGATPVSRMVGLTSAARAIEYVQDTFDDGSVTDGIPLNWIVPGWIPNGQFRVENGDLTLTASNIPPTVPGADPSFTEMDIVADGVVVRDLSFRTRVRGLLPANPSAPYWIGFNVRDTLTRDWITGSSINAAIQSNGMLAVTYLLDNEISGPPTGVDVARVSTGLNFVTEDVNLQLNVEGNQVRFTAWGVSQQKPQTPQIVGTLPNTLDDSGTVVLWTLPRSSDWNKPVAFRHVEVAPIPEPSTAALGSLGVVAVAAFGFRNRLNRVRHQTYFTLRDEAR
jgi:hypothetical protein